MTGLVRLNGNPKLQLNSGDFKQLRRASSVEVSQNSALKSVDGFSSLDTLASNLVVENNQGLRQIGFGELMGIGGDLKLSNNGPGFVLRTTSFSKVRTLYLSAPFLCNGGNSRRCVLDRHHAGDMHRR